ncbi:unnamed protein product [Triticum turgidum subsp. durum]|uniref:Very-long-chain (3R)-3-hydroxyacyl-CoA dehydratase n=1 Tax=Triticum turgidum subsp. durum TaxID=4567 RepID=A0A9R0RA20_TRITD|nr:unnamed protein product [Triticum turgidum subsp. durum]
MSCELPDGYATQEVNHLTLAYFAVAGLSLLRELDRVNKDQIAKWILSFQVHPEENDDLDNGQFYGFCGSRTTKFPSNLVKDPCHNGSHLASTYSALATLKIVGYDVLNLDSNVLLLSMKKLQQPDGSFMPTHIGAETDLRFVYCAAAICSMLKDWSGMDKEKAKEYILNCQSYDGGFGMVPGSESHGRQCISLPGYFMERQAADGGFQGRRNKPSDTCYAFWAQVLYYAVTALLGGGHEGVYAAVERPLQLAQTAAVMEFFLDLYIYSSNLLYFFAHPSLRVTDNLVFAWHWRSCCWWAQILHGLVGLVRSPVTATLPQIGSRLFLTWGILWSFPETQSHILVTSLVISWSITEIIRYSFFGLKETLGFAPSWLLWLRYSTFLILYPTGILSEVGLIYIALPYIKVSEKYLVKMPNKWNFSFDYFYTCAIAIGVYVPGGPHMFTYMLAQRKKALSKAKTA